MKIVLVGAELEENLGLRYLEGALLADGHEVAIVPFEWPQQIERAAAAIAHSGAGIAGFSMVFTRRGREFAQLIGRVRELGFAGTTVAGGSFAAFHAEQVLRDVPGLDLVAIGEGERILCELARDPGAADRVAGLVRRAGDGSIQHNPPAVVEEDLDRLPWPTHRRPYDRFLGMPIVNMLSSRGCTYACAFCSIAAWHKLCGGSRYRVRKPEAIAAEMACLWRDGVRLFNFHDDNFLGRDRDENLRRARSLGEALDAQGVGNIGFQIKARPDAVDAEVFAVLRSIGLFRVFLGVEAGTAESLKALGRGQKLADNVQALAILNDLDLHIAFNLLLLNPDSTLDDLAGNVAFLRANSRNPLNFCRTEIYAETPLERRMRKEGRLFGDYWGLDYVIADRQAQRAFDVHRVAFYERCFGMHPLHYLSAQVDYEHQLRADFYSTTPALRVAAKGFVRRVNENTASHLEDIIDAVRAGAATDEYAARLAARVARDDEQLHAEGRALVERLRDLSRPAETTRRASAKVAAAAALALSACSGATVTQPMEAAPPPPYAGPPDAGADAAGPVQPPQPMEAAPPPPDDPYQQREAAPPPPHSGPRSP